MSETFTDLVLFALGRYRGWPDAEPGSRWDKWIRAAVEAESVKRTTSTDELYLDSYERYAEVSREVCRIPEVRHLIKV